MPSYREQYDKIIQAYFRGEIKPFDAHFCFCGTLCGNNPSWCINSIGGVHRDYGDYSGKEYAIMEKALFNGLITKDGFLNEFHRRYEDLLFNGMSAALEVLKQIHISRGEKIDEDIPQFTKRNLSTNKIKENELH